MENNTTENTSPEKNPWGKLTPAEKKEILRNLRKKLETDEVEALGNYRFKSSKKERVIVGDSYTYLTRDKLYDENGNHIPTNPEYHNIFGFFKGVANVCIRSSIQFIEAETGPRFTQDRKDGLIDINGKELLPCIYDSIHVQGDGFVEISKDGKCRTTRVNNLIDKKFAWDEN